MSNTAVQKILSSDVKNPAANNTFTGQLLYIQAMEDGSYANSIRLVMQEKSKNTPTTLRTSLAKIGVLPINLGSLLDIKAALERGEQYTFHRVIEANVYCNSVNKYPVVSDITVASVAERQNQFIQTVGQSRKPDWSAPLGTTPFTPIEVPMGIQFSESNSDTTRIGYAKLTVPILHVEQSRNSHLITAPALRQSSTLKKGTGRAYETYTISYIADGPDEIQRNVVDLLDQIMLNPFLSVEGGPFNGPYTPHTLTEPDGEIPYGAIAVRNFSVSTVEGYPNQIAVSLSFDPFLWDMYTPPLATKEYPRFNFDDMICWPLVKIWCQTRSKVRYSGKSFDGRFGYYIPSQDNLDAILNIVADPDITPTTIDCESLQILSSVTSDRDPILMTRNVRKASLDAGTVGTYTLKVSSPKLWTKLQNAFAKTGGNCVVGYADWSVVDAQSTYTNANQLSDSIAVELKLSQNQYISGFKQKADLDAAIALQTRTQLPPAASGSVQSVNYVNDRVQNPYRHYAFILQVTDTNKAELHRTLANAIKEETKTTYLSASPQEKLTQLTQSVSVDAKEYFGEDVVIEKITASKGHNLATLNLEHNPLPLHQYTGGLDSLVIVEGKCFGLNAKQQVEALKKEFDEQCLRRKSTKYLTEQGGTGIPFMAIDNELFALMGVYHAMPLTLSMQSVDGQPDVWAFSITFIEFDPLTLKNEKLQILKTKWAYEDSAEYGLSDIDDPLHHPFIKNAEEWLEFNNQLAKYDVYSDLKLPTHAEFRMWLSACKKIAALYVKGLNQSKFDLNVAVAKSTELTNEEKGIYPYIKEFITPILSAAPRMAKWKINDSSSRFNEPAELKVDPDFYCYYDAKDTFLQTFDNLVSNTHGKPGQPLDTSSSNPLVPNYREIDNKVGTTAVGDPTMFASARYADTTKILKTLDESRRADPVGKQIADVEAAANLKMINQTPNKWWNEIQGDLLAPMGKTGPAAATWQFNTVADEMMLANEAYPGTDNSYNPIPNWGHLKSTNESQRGETGLTAEELVYQNMTRYFSSEVRRQLTYDTGKKFLQQKKVPIWLPPTLAGYDFAAVPGFMINITDIFNFGGEQYFGGYWRESGDDYVGIRRTPKSDFLSNGTLSQWKSYIDWKASHTKLRAEEPDSAIPEEFSGLGSFEGLCWVQRTALTNNMLGNIDYTAVAKQTAITDGTSFTSRAGKVDVLIRAAIGKNYLNGVNPDVIASIIYTRDRFGGVSVTDGEGLGKFDTNIPFSSANNLKGWSNNINQLVKVYSKGLSKYKDPIFAVAYTHMLTTPPSEWSAKSKWVNGSELTAEAKAELSSIVTAYHSASSDQKVSLIKRLSNTFGIGPILNVNVARYYQWCRANGSVVATRNGVVVRDIFFDPGHYFITVEDPNSWANNSYTNKNQDGIFVSKNFSPSDEPLSIAIKDSMTENLPSQALMGDSSTLNLPPNLLQRLEKKVSVAMVPEDEANIWASYSDFRKYSNFGRFLGAFPSYLVAIINEGFYWGDGNKRLWDQYFLRGGVSAIEIFKSRKEASSSCSVTFSNTFYTLSALAQQEAYQQVIGKAISQNLGNLGKFATVEGGLSEFGEMLGEVINEAFWKKVPEDAKKLWYHNQLQQIVLGVGARLHVRMGFGRADNLPVVFNGTVVEAPVSEGFMTVVAAGDGSELNKNISHNLVRAQSGFAYQSVGAIGIGKDPSSIITESMIAVGLGDYLFEGNFRDRSQGVQHFGEIVFSRTKHQPAELQLNIYSSSNTKLEQSIPFLRNYYNLNALVNYDNVNLFGIQVKEPTVWKVANVCKHACLDFVTDALPFGTRSTLFFGKWWWPYNYEYDQSIWQIKQAFQGISNSIALNTSSDQSSYQAAMVESYGKYFTNRALSINPLPVGVKPLMVCRSALNNDLLEFNIPVGQLDANEANFWDYLRPSGSRDAAPMQQFGDDLVGWRYRVPDGAKKPIKLVFANRKKAYLEDIAAEVAATGKAIRYVLRPRDELNMSFKSGTAPGTNQSYKDAVHSAMQEKWGISYGVTRQGMYDKGLSYENLTPGEASLTWGIAEIVYDSESDGQIVDWFFPEMINGRDGVFHAYTTDLEKRFKTPLSNLSNKDSMYRGLYEAVSDITADASLLASFCKWKNYQQAHLISSSLNLISNTVYADKSQVFTDAYATYTYNGPLSRDVMAKTIVYSADTDIIATDRRTLAVDTGLYTTIAMEGDKAVKSFFSGWVPGIGEDIKGVETVPAVYNSVISSLAESMKDMYQGWLMATGCTAIKPRDFVYLSDHIHDMHGPIFVKEVIHRLDGQTGLVTLVCPDACVFNQASYLGQKMVMGQDFLFSKFNGVITYKTMSAAIWGSWKNRLRNNAVRAAFQNAEEYHIVRAMVKADQEAVVRSAIAGSLNSEKIANLEAARDEKLAGLIKQLETADEKGAQAIVTQINEVTMDFDKILNPEKYSLKEVMEAFNLREPGMLEQVEDAVLKIKLAEDKIEKKQKMLRLLFENRPKNDAEYRSLVRKYYPELGEVSAAQSELMGELKRTAQFADKMVIEGSTPEEVTLAIERIISADREAVALVNKDLFASIIKTELEKVSVDDVKQLITRLRTSDSVLTGADLTEAKKIYLYMLSKKGRKGIVGYSKADRKFLEKLLAKVESVISSEGSYKSTISAFLEDLVDGPTTIINGVKKFKSTTPLKFNPSAIFHPRRTIKRIKNNLINPNDPDGVLNVAVATDDAEAAGNYLKQQAIADAKNKILKDAADATDDEMKNVLKDVQMRKRLEIELANLMKDAEVDKEAIKKITDAMNTIDGKYPNRNVTAKWNTYLSNLRGMGDTKRLAKLEPALSALEELVAAEKIMDETKAAAKIVALTKAGNFAKDILGSAKASFAMAKTLKSSNVYSLAAQVAVYFIGGGFADWINYSLKARQCVKVVPLRLGTVPWVAGMTGHQGAVLGDDPSWSDKFFTNIMGSSEVMWASLILGLDAEIPENLAVTELDKEWQKLESN